jgi:hypothetical protein
MRSLLYVLAASAAAWVGVDLLYKFLRFPEAYGRIFPL